MTNSFNPKNRNTLKIQIFEAKNQTTFIDDRFLSHRIHIKLQTSSLKYAVVDAFDVQTFNLKYLTQWL